jgi:hypothetical protein
VFANMASFQHRQLFVAFGKSIQDPIHVWIPVLLIEEFNFVRGFKPFNQDRSGMRRVKFMHFTKNFAILQGWSFDWIEQRHFPTLTIAHHKVTSFAN